MATASLSAGAQIIYKWRALGGSDWYEILIYAKDMQYTVGDGQGVTILESWYVWRRRADSCRAAAFTCRAAALTCRAAALTSAALTSAALAFAALAFAALTHSLSLPLRSRLLLLTSCGLASALLSPPLLSPHGRCLALRSHPLLTQWARHGERP